MRNALIPSGLALAALLLPSPIAAAPTDTLADGFARQDPRLDPHIGGPGNGAQRTRRQHEPVVPLGDVTEFGEQLIFEADCGEITGLDGV